MSNKVTPIRENIRGGTGNWRVDRDPAEGGRETVDEAMAERRTDAAETQSPEAAESEEVVADPEGVERHLKTPAA
jgi:hypothetical protein